MPWKQATNVITGVVSSEFLKPGSGEYLTSQLSPAVAAVATNVVTGTAPLAAAAAPYVVRVGGYFAAGAFDYVLGKALISEFAAIKNGKCKPCHKDTRS